MEDFLGVPPVTASTPNGIDQVGRNCRISPSVTVFRHHYREHERGIRIGDEVVIFDHVRLLVGDLQGCPGADIRIGNRVIINVGCYISGEGGLYIEDGVIIGAHARILSAGHDVYGPAEWVNDNPLTFDSIRIGCGAWIGAGATLLQGRQIGAGAVVGAGSVVTRDVPDFAVVGGNPARLLGRRRGRRQHGIRRWLRGLLPSG